jgi:hypothetical protein
LVKDAKVGKMNSFRLEKTLLVVKKEQERRHTRKWSVRTFDEGNHEGPHQGDVVLKIPSFAAIMVLNVNPKQDEIGDLMVQVTHSKKKSIMQLWLNMKNVKACNKRKGSTISHTPMNVPIINHILLI